MESQGSFRGVSFLVIDESQIQGGQRVVKHEYPLRDEGDSESLGLKLRLYTFSAVVLGNNYVTEKNALIAALDTRNSGELVHPVFGKLEIQVEEWSCSESTNSGGSALFSVTFSKFALPKPITTENSGAALDKLKSQFLASLVDDFDSSWSKITATAAQLESATGLVEMVLITIAGSIRGAAGSAGLPTLLANALSIQGAVSSLINSPRQLAKSIQYLLSGLSNIGSSRDVQSGLNKILFQNQSQSTELPTPKSIVSVLVTGSVLAELAAVVVRDIESVINENNLDNQSDNHLVETLTDGKQLTSEITSNLVGLTLQAGNYGWYQTVRQSGQFRQKITENLSSLTSQLPAGRQVEITSTTPALVILYQETDSSLGVNRFCRRNSVKNPNFVTGGARYEVIQNEAG